MYSIGLIPKNSHKNIVTRSLLWLLFRKLLSQGAEAWMEATSCELEVYLDPERRVYSLLGLQRSIHKVWNMDTVHFYAQAWTKPERKIFTFMNDADLVRIDCPGSGTEPNMSCFNPNPHCLLVAVVGHTSICLVHSSNLHKSSKNKYEWIISLVSGERGAKLGHIC